MIMDWMQALFLFIATAGLIIWFKGESRSDYKHLESKIDDLNNKMDSKFDGLMLLIHQDMKEFQKEIKDFHGRLCALEEKRK